MNKLNYLHMKRKNLFVKQKVSYIILQLNNKNKFDKHDILFADAQSREDHLKEDEVQVR